MRFLRRLHGAEGSCHPQDAWMLRNGSFLGRYMLELWGGSKSARRAPQRRPIDPHRVAMPSSSQPAFPSMLRWGTGEPPAAAGRVGRSPSPGGVRA